jgi:uncharacterized membrane protein YdjX (TVP38/TMEM64 family)
MIWTEDNPYIGIIVFMAVNIIMVPLFIPGTIFAILGAYIYGMIYGKTAGYFIDLIVIVISNTLGGYMAFLASRWLFYDCLSGVMHRYKYMRAMNRSVAKHGFKLMILFRNCPIVPYNCFNYLVAVTDMTHRQYFWGTFLGMIPLKAIEVFIFINLTVDIASIIEGEYELGTGYTIILIIGIVMAIILIIILIVLTRRELHNELRLAATRSLESINLV